MAVVPLGRGIDGLGGCVPRVCVGDGPGAELFVAAGQLLWDERLLLAACQIALPGRSQPRQPDGRRRMPGRRVDRNVAAEALRTFRGFAHRLEDLAATGEVRFVNDSEATNVGSTPGALASFSGGIHLILGVRGKAQDFTPLAARCRIVQTGCSGRSQTRRSHKLNPGEQVAPASSAAPLGATAQTQAANRSIVNAELKAEKPAAASPVGHRTAEAERSPQRGFYRIISGASAPV